MRRAFWPLLLILLIGCVSQGDKPMAEQGLRELEEDLTAKHPAAYFHLARALWDRGNKDRAATMYYVGQIRYRAYINTLPEGEAAAQEKAYDTLKAELGSEINEYGGRNLDRWVALLDGAIKWHQDNPSQFLPEEEYRLLYDLTLYNFSRLREYIVNNKALIRQQRAQQGLPNEK